MSKIKAEKESNENKEEVTSLDTQKEIETKTTETPSEEISEAVIKKGVFSRFKEN